MTPALHYANLCVRTAWHDRAGNPWLWLAPLLVLQQSADIDGEGWILYFLPAFGVILGRAILGRGVLPGGSSSVSMPGIALPLTAQHRVLGGLLASTLIAAAAFVSLRTLGAFAGEAFDLAVTRKDTHTFDVGVIVRQSAVGLLATLPLCALSFAPLAGRELPYALPVMATVVGLAWQMEFPIILGDLSILAFWSYALCSAAWIAAPFVERLSLRDRALPLLQRMRSWLPTRAAPGVLGATPSSPGRALVGLHLHHAPSFALVLLGVLAAQTTLVLWMDRSAASLPPVLVVMAAGLSVVFPSTPSSVRPGQSTGAVGVCADVSARLPVRLPTVWWTGLLVAAVQSMAGLSLAAALVYAIRAIRPLGEAADRSFAHALTTLPAWLALGLLFRAGINMGGLLHPWARAACIVAGSGLILTLPVSLALPPAWLPLGPGTMSWLILAGTLAFVGVLTPRRPRVA